MHDIDKTHEQRLNPSPNSNDEVSTRLAHGTTQNHNSKELATDNGLKFKERQIIAKQDGFNKAAFGFYSSSNKFGLKVAKEGVDVLTAADIDLVFNSEQNVFKIVGRPITLNLTVTKTGGVSDTGYGVTTYIHGLTFTPSYTAYHVVDTTLAALLTTPTKNNPNPAFGFVFSGGGSLQTYYACYVSIDSTKITYQVFLSSFIGAGTYSFSTNVYLLQETAV